MKQLIEEQSKIETDFNTKFGFGIWQAGIRKIFSSDVLEFIKERNKQSLKQFIDELIAKNEELKKGKRAYFGRETSYEMENKNGYHEAVNDVLSHLKELKEQLN